MCITRIPIKSGTAFHLKKGEKLKVICPEGEQVSDMVCFDKNDLENRLSNGKTFDYEECLLLSTDNYLWSNKSDKMLRILEDTCGIHDFLLAPCDTKTFEIIYKDKGPRPSCFNNLYQNLKEYGVKETLVPTAFNIFMNVPFDWEGKISVEPPRAEAGDYIIFQAEMDLLIGLTACSAEQSNNNTFKPIDYEIIPVEVKEDSQ